MQLDLQEINPIFASLNNTDGYVIFDLPGKIDDNNLVTVYQNADLVICPFSYDKLTFESTLVFTQVIRHINVDVPIVFLPNRLKMSVNYTIREKVDNVLSDYGVIAPAVTDRVALQRLNCLTFSEAAASVLTKTYDFINDKYLVNDVKMIKSEGND
jgi:chromosome partitioning protein